MIGRAFSVKKLISFKASETPHNRSETLWVSGTAYEYGMLPPRYPMPAIRQGFEFGQRWPDGKCVLLEWRQESYSD